jgi:hypothetical protein
LNKTIHLKHIKDVAIDDAYNAISDLKKADVDWPELPVLEKAVAKLQDENLE